MGSAEEEGEEGEEGQGQEEEGEGKGEGEEAQGEGEERRGQGQERQEGEKEGKEGQGEGKDQRKRHSVDGPQNHISIRNGALFSPAGHTLIHSEIDIQTNGRKRTRAGGEPTRRSCCCCCCWCCCWCCCCCCWRHQFAGTGTSRSGQVLSADHPTSEVGESRQERSSTQ